MGKFFLIATTWIKKILRYISIRTSEVLTGCDQQRLHFDQKKKKKQPCEYWFIRKAENIQQQNFNVSKRSAATRIKNKTTCELWLLFCCWLIKCTQPQNQTPTLIFKTSYDAKPHSETIEPVTFYATETKQGSIKEGKSQIFHIKAHFSHIKARSSRHASCLFWLVCSVDHHGRHEFPSFVEDGLNSECELQRDTVQTSGKRF